MALPAHNSRRWVGTQQCNTFKQLHPFNQLIPSAHRCQTSYQKDRQATTIDSAAACSLSRRGALLASLLLSAPGLVAWPAHAAASKQKINPRLIEAFQKAMAANGNYEAMEAGWTQAINIDPNSAPAWSNRGTARLQNSQWQAAYEDLAHALQLEQQQTGQPSALLLNNLGNTEAALGQWQDAMQHYQQATEDSELSSIALANYALAAFEIGDAELAIKSARRVLCRVPEFMDMRCALTAFFWGCGRRLDAEESWEELQQSCDGLGAAMYSRSSAVERVRHRWPPRATAALTAFLYLSSSAQAEGYDLQMHDYTFPAAA